MATPKITLYIDTVSPFAYIAYYILRVSLLGPQPWHKHNTSNHAGRISLVTLLGFQEECS